MSCERRIDDATRKALCDKVELHELVGRSVPLKRVGSEYQARCPFHDEASASFTVAPVKGFYHCFGCGAHGDAVSWLIEHQGLEFVEACKVLAERAFDRLPPSKYVAPSALPKNLPPEGRWLPLLPVPEAAPALLGADGRTVEVWNPKQSDQHPDGRFVRYRPTRADAYRDARGRLLGYVVRLEFKGDNGKPVKITPTLTWCVGPDGTQQWCVQHFRPLRPMLGLDALAALPEAHVLVVEGEKCRAAGASALPQYAVVSWPSGSKGIGYVDWAPLSGRHVVMWPDADVPGREAMLGYVDHAGVLHRGIAQLAHRAGAASLRFIDTDGQPKGWDIADALDPAGDGWTARQLAAWAAVRVCDIEVEIESGRVAR